MDRQTALLVLQLPEAPTPEEIHDAFEAHVFGLRDFLFRQTVIPQVFRAKVDRLLTASEVGETLGAELPCLDGKLPDMLPLEGTADQVVRLHAANVGRLRPPWRPPWTPTASPGFGECLVRIQQQYVRGCHGMGQERVLDDTQHRPMRDEWAADALADALENERKGQPLDAKTGGAVVRGIASVEDIGPVRPFRSPPDSGTIQLRIQAQNDAIGQSHFGHQNALAAPTMLMASK